MGEIFLFPVAQGFLMIETFQTLPVERQIEIVDPILGRHFTDATLCSLMMAFIRARALYVEVPADRSTLSVLQGVADDEPLRKNEIDSRASLGCLFNIRTRTDCCGRDWVLREQTLMAVHVVTQGPNGYGCLCYQTNAYPLDDSTFDPIDGAALSPLLGRPLGAFDWEPESRQSSRAQLLRTPWIDKVAAINVDLQHDALVGFRDIIANGTIGLLHSHTSPMLRP